MRWISWVLAFLLLAGSIAAELPPIVAPNESAAADLWRRTRDGWERAEWLYPPRTSDPLWLHPAVLATFEIAVSAAALRAASGSNVGASGDALEIR